MKKLKLANDREFDPVDEARGLLSSVPTLEIGSVEYEIGVDHGERIDARIDFSHGGAEYALIIEVKSNGAPRFVRSAIYRLESCLTHLRRASAPDAGRRFIPMLVSPYLSPDSRAICIEHDVAYLDFVGNAHLKFYNVYIDRAVSVKPKSESRALRSIFSPKAGAILRALLRDPGRAWRVADLAKEASASLGHVSNVCKVLREREWAERQKKGIVLHRPAALLENWRAEYRRPVSRRIESYTHLHGKQLDECLSEVLNPYRQRPRAIYSLNSAANWLAPFGRDGTHNFYTDESGARLLSESLKLTLVAKGANVILRVPADDSLFNDAVEPAPGIFCTDPIVTYLDLWNGGDRDRETADHLAEECFPWL